jgi:hypothetical protein
VITPVPWRLVILDPKTKERSRLLTRELYLRFLTWAFTLFNSIRVIAYAPTIWAIHASGDSSQHSLWTWIIWAGANATMAAWLYEHNGRRVNRAIAVNMGNAAMCVATVAVIVVYRL